MLSTKIQLMQVAAVCVRADDLFNVSRRPVHSWDRLPDNVNVRSVLNIFHKLLCRTNAAASCQIAVHCCLIDHIVSRPSTMASWVICPSEVFWPYDRGNIPRHARDMKRELEIPRCRPSSSSSRCDLFVVLRDVTDTWKDTGDSREIIGKRLLYLEIPTIYIYT